MAFTSIKLLPREIRYGTIEKECLAIVLVLRKFHVFLYGQEFTMETDHARLTRWALQIQLYQFELKFLMGC